MNSKKSDKKSFNKIRVNVNYINFICYLIKKKIVDSNKIISNYEEVLNNRFNNINRVNDRCLRIELDNDLMKNLNINKVSKEDYKKKCEEVLSYNVKGRRKVIKEFNF